MPRSVIKDKRINRMYNYLVNEPKEKALKLIEEDGRRENDIS